MAMKLSEFFSKAPDEQPIGASSEQEELERFRIRDNLTGVFNEEFVRYMLSNQISNGRRYGAIFTMAVIDIDHFSLLCAEYGKSTSDAILAVVAKMIGGKLRETDFVGRIGDNEFMAVLPHTDLSTALIPLERLREAVKAQSFSPGDLKVTISGGVTEYTGETPNAMIEHGKRLLINATDSGGNQYCFDIDEA